jgi:aryl-alcohol dehydrogenase-like predicted oxidoreductase
MELMLRPIGDAEVSPIALGTANLSIDESVSREDADRTIDAAVEAGITFIDTAAAYASATDSRHSEKLVARALTRHPHLFVATKGGHTRPGIEWGIDGRPGAIVRDCEDSLRILGVERIDLYYLHKPDPKVDLLESIAALAELKRAGKIARIGLSNVSAGQLAAALDVVPIDAVQNRFSALDTRDAETLRSCERRGIAYLPYSPLGGLSGSGGLESSFPRATALALSRGLSLRSVLLAWLLSLSLSGRVIPVVGARRPSSIVDSARAMSLELDDELVAAIEQDQAAPVP